MVELNSQIDRLEMLCEQLITYLRTTDRSSTDANVRRADLQGDGAPEAKALSTGNCARPTANSLKPVADAPIGASILLEFALDVFVLPALWLPRCVRSASYCGASTNFLLSIAPDAPLRERARLLLSRLLLHLGAASA